jgi:BirA family biotin operon repressor/biotin-[acetyl-CoA-carboxylase] ligase
LGRAWGDGFGNFMGSVTVHLNASDPMPATLALVSAVALADTVKALAPKLPFTLKWPNDLLLDGAKCAGILLERSGNAIVIGIGVNLVSAPELPDRRTACLAEYGVNLARDTFADALAISMMDALHSWRGEGISAIIRRWLPLAHPIGTPLRVTEQNIDGLFSGLSQEGALCLKLATGQVVEVHAGDVELLRAVDKGV